MTRLRIASLLVAVVAGDYAALMLISGQLIDFGVAVAICAGSSVTAGLVGYSSKRRHEDVARGRAAVRERRDQPTIIAADQQCPFCPGAGGTLSDTFRLVDRWADRSGRHECRCTTGSGHDKPAGAGGASSETSTTPRSVPVDRGLPLGSPGITYSDLGRPAATRVNWLAG